jgi:putative transposase
MGTTSVLREGVDMKYGMIDKLRLHYPITDLCRHLELSTRGYYSWRSRPLSCRSQDNSRLKLVILSAHKRTRETYGPERLQQDIVEHEGLQLGVHRIKRHRKELGIKCRIKRKFKVTTDSNHSLPVAENLVGQNFQATVPNQVWVTDITYIFPKEERLYLAVHKGHF